MSTSIFYSKNYDVFVNFKFYESNRYDEQLLFVENKIIHFSKIIKQKYVRKYFYF